MTIRIRGLVGLANAVRQEMAEPMPDLRAVDLGRAIRETVRMVDELLARRRATVASLSPQSRRAYEYLRDVKLVRPAKGRNARRRQTSVAAAQPDSVRFPGLRKFLKRVCDLVACLPDPRRLDEIHRSIAGASNGIERIMNTDGFEGRHLRPEARELRGWLAYFAQRPRFDAYVAAVRRARPVFEQAARRSKHYRAPVRVQFAPVRVLYRVRGFEDHTLVQLPTPMITLDADAFAALAEAAFGLAGTRRPTTDFFGLEYQETLAALRRLSGPAAPAGGRHHDLEQAFDRVNLRYFHGRMPRPELTWNKRLTYRKFGHYDHAHDTVMVACTLDQPDVPTYVVDYILYHELLHKKHGLQWRDGRRAAHTRGFGREERLFHRYEQAVAFLRRLAARR